MITRTRTAVVVFALLALLCAVLSFALPAGAAPAATRPALHQSTTAAATQDDTNGGSGGLAAGQVVALGGGAICLVLLSGGALMVLAGRRRTAQLADGPGPSTEN